MAQEAERRAEEEKTAKLKAEREAAASERDRRKGGRVID